MSLYKKIADTAITRAAMHAGYRYDLAGRVLMDAVTDLLTTPGSTARDAAERYEAVGALTDAWTEIRALAVAADAADGAEVTR